MARDDAGPGDLGCLPVIELAADTVFRDVGIDLLSYPYLRADIEVTFVEEVGLTPAEARCASGPLLTGLTLDELTAASPSAAVSALVDDAVAACTQK